MRPNFDLGPRYAEGACANWVAIAGFRQGHASAGGARAWRARAYNFFFLNIN